MQRLSELKSITEFKVEECIYCFAPFAFTNELYRQRSNDCKSFWCPACGRSMAYMESAKDKELREAKTALERAEKDARNARTVALAERVSAAEVRKQYTKIRNRVRKGMCPCCNETFPSLAQHMQTKHAEFGANDLVRALREAYGLTQEALAKELGISAPQVSLFETGKALGSYAKRRIDQWLSQQVTA